uniref:Integrase catalytic domain-containing protein n=1 Tax=Angiostrongylus cantonensis TaxID=6313 RepID=A0A0K0DDC0_ANGCA
MNHNYVDEACLIYEVVRQPLMQTMHALTRDRGREFYDNVCDLYARQMKEFSLRGEGTSNFS